MLSFSVEEKSFSRLSLLTLIVVLGLSANMTFAQDDWGGGVTDSEGATDDTASKIDHLFKSGIDLYEMGKYAEAQAKFRQMLDLDPKAEEAWKLVRMAGDQVYFSMLTDPAMQGREHRVIWNLYRLHSKRLQRKPEVITTLVNIAVNPQENPKRRWDSLERLKDVGQFAIPYLVDHLGDERDDEVRALARICAVAMRRNATLPVIELLAYKGTDSKALLIRENAANILGDIGDTRALPALKRVIEDTEETVAVRKYAIMALQKITGMDKDKFRSAQDYYSLSAGLYLREAPGVTVDASNADGVIWYVEEGKLIDRQVARFAWNECMAEKLCYECIEIDPEYEAIYPLLGAVIASQIAETWELTDVAAERPYGRPFTSEEVNKVRSYEKRLMVEDLVIDSMGPAFISSGKIKMPRTNVRRNLILTSLGAKYIYRAIDKCLDDATSDRRELPQLAVEVLCDAAFALDPDGTLLPASSKRNEVSKAGAALIRALRFSVTDNRHIYEADENGLPVLKKTEEIKRSALRVQYAAATALARMNRTNTFDGAGEVVKVLSAAISESGPIQVLVIEENSSISNEIVGKLQDLGIGVLTATSPRAGLTRAVSFPPVDAILLAPKFTGEDSTQWLLEQLAGDDNACGLPVAIISSYENREADSAAFSSFTAVKGLLPVEDEGPELKKLIERLAAERGSPIMTKVNAERLAVRAAEALSLLNPDTARASGMNLMDCSKECINALKNRSDAVRRPCIDALGKFGITEAHSALVTIATATHESLQIRASALRAVANITPELDMGRLLKLADLESNEYILRYLAAEGYARAKELSPTQVAEALKLLRLAPLGERVMQAKEESSGFFD